MTRWATARQAIGLAALVGLAVTMLTPLSNALASLQEVPGRLEPADAIVVLGGGLGDDGTLSNSSMRRLLRGILLHRDGYAPLLVLLGELQAGPRAEAEVRADLAAALGVPRQAILGEVRARTTREEALRVRERLGARRILLVTDALHMARADAAFRRVGFDVLPAPIQEPSGAAANPEGRLWLMRRVSQEILATALYRVMGHL